MTRRALVRLGLVGVWVIWVSGPVRVIWVVRLEFGVNGVGVVVVVVGLVGLDLVNATRVVIVRKLLELVLDLARVRLWLELWDVGVWIVRLNRLNGLNGLCGLGWVGWLLGWVGWLLGNNLCLGR